MHLKAVDTFGELSPQEFKTKYHNRPVVIKDLSKQWTAYHKWTWDYFISIVGDVQVGLYNNVKSDAYTPINTADAYMKFGDYLEIVKKGPVELRVFLFNIFDNAPQIINDITWPDQYMNTFVKRYPMLFVGGEGSVTHMHFDIDMSHIFHTQFVGKKRVLLFPYEEKDKLYRKPWEVLSEVNYQNYHQNSIDFEKYPALKYAQGYEVILEHGDTLFMPSGYWHHMEYIESGFALSLRALQSSMFGKMHGVWNLFGMRGIDTMMKKTAPEWWYDYKKKKIASSAAQVLKQYQH